MIPNTDVQRLQATLKRLFKGRELRYSDIASTLGVSEPTVKRYMTRTDISVEQLASLAGCIGLNLFDLMNLTYQETPEQISLTDTQEEFLTLNPNFCAYLVALKDGLSPQAIAKKFQLNHRSTERYLLGLDKMGFINYGPNFKVSLKLRFINLLEAPKLRTAFYRGMLEVAPDHFKKQIDNGGNAYLRMDFFTLTSGTYRELQKDLESLHKKYLLATKYESLNTSGETKTVTYIALSDMWQHPAFMQIITNI